MAEAEKSAKTEKTEVVIKSTDGKHRKTPAIVAFTHELDAVEGFVGFLRERAVVGLAVGFIIGAQAQQLVKQLVDSFIAPGLNMLIGQNLVNKKTVLHSHGAEVPFAWGKFIYSLVSFLAVVLSVYLIIKLTKLDKLDKPVKKKKK